MAALTGNSIDSSYQGLIKTTDNGAITGTAKAVTDGLGNATNIEISNTATNFVSGTVDFTGSTVSGLPTSSAGMVSGTGTDSIKSADALTTNAPTSSGNGTIAIGNGANASGANGSIAIGEGALADGDRSIAIGEGSGFLTGVESRGVCVGYNTGFGGGTDIVSIGYNSTAKANGAISLGDSARVDDSGATDAIAIGNLTTVTTAAPGAVNINTGTLTAGETNTVSVKALQTLTDGGVSIKGDGTNAGKLKLFCEDASGAHNITLEGPAHAGGSTYTLKFPNTQSAGSQILEADSSGNLSWVNTPSAGAAGLESGSGSDSMQSASALTSADPANASGNEAIALGYGAEATGNRSVSIGIVAQDNGYQKGVAIGNSSRNNGEEATAVGTGAQAKQNAFAGGKAAEAGENSVAIGNSANNSTINNAVAIGLSSYVGSNAGVAIGSYQQAINEGDVVIGDGNSMASKTYFEGDVVIGRDNASSTTNGGRNVLIGDNNTVSQNERCNLIGSENSAARGDHSILGYNNTTQTQYQIAVVGNSNTASGEKSFIGGHSSSTTATGAVALGDSITASRAQTVAGKQFESKTAGQGIVVTSPDGNTTLGIGIDNSGNIVTYTP